MAHETLVRPLKPDMIPGDEGSEPVDVLIVDDRPDKLLALEAILAPLNQRLVRAASGEEALRLVLRNDFALILLDVNMPGIDGFETASLIRQRESTKDIPIIFVSILEPSDERVRQAYQLRAVDYVPSPAAPEALLSKVACFVELHRKNKRLKQLTEELQAKNKQLEHFSYAVAHDLRAPLRAMQGLANTLIEDKATDMDEQTKDFLYRIRHSAHRMDALIMDLLVYTRQQLLELVPEPVSLSEVVTSTVNYLELEISQRKASVSVGNVEFRVLAHKESLMQALINLVSNALKFIVEGRSPQIKIQAAAQGQMVRVSVQDNGIGIDPKYQNKIYEIFQRLPSTRHIEGTGVGLAIVKTAIERMGGEVGVESTPGQGSICWFTIPVAKVD
jgi:two-component system, sensor histidine kinase and response regulator